MQFLADENVSHRVIDRLRADGLDVTSIAGPFSGISDAEVLKVADAAGRILITEDRDFGELVVRQRLGVRGVILLELVASRTQPRRIVSQPWFSRMPTSLKAISS